MFQKNKGFTLIELLVVIAIIGLLASIVLVSLNSARTKARDVRRMADLKQIQIALEMYYDTNNTYPVVPGWVCSTAGGAWIPGLSAYMSKVPVDPVNNAAYPWATGNFSYCYGYATASYPGTYDLVAQLENTSDNNRCEKQCWKIHSWSPGTPWCAACSGGAGYSPYMYADH